MALKRETPSGKSALLQRWLSRKQSAVAEPVIDPMPAGVLAPLSFGQQRLWFLQQLFPDNSFYHYAELLRFRGPLQEKVLIRSFYQVAEIQGSLRTTFHLEEGGVVQRIDPAPGFDIRRFDLSEYSSAQAEERAKALALEEARRPFDLSRGPLVRLSFFRLAGDDHILLLTLHHIITDKWSMNILRERLSATYCALLRNEFKPLTPLPLQYVDFSYWQRRQAQAPHHLSYWQKKLAGHLPVLQLPADHARPSRPSYRGALCRQTLSATLSAKLKALSKEQRITMFVLLLAVFKVFLNRYTQQGDILVGTPVTDRDRVELEQLIGFFNNTVVLRSDLSSDLPFTDLVKQVRQTVLEAFSHKATPLETLVKLLKPERLMSSNPLFQVMFLYHKGSPLLNFGPELTLETSPFDLGVSKFDLTLYVAEVAEQLTLIFEYSTDLFERSTIQRMLAQFTMLLESVVDHPGMAISRLPMLPGEEKKLLLQHFNQTEADPLPDQSIHQFIEEQARIRPHHTAVVYDDEQLSYQQLNDRAEAVARHLQERGVVPETCVGLFVNRSVEMIIGIVGILKAGGAYVPLDPEYPAERIEFMVEDANMPVILLQDQLAPLLPATAAQLLSFAEILNAPPPEPERAAVSAKSEQLAYLIYTSGSSGRPKGVMVSHQNIVHSTLARDHFYPAPPKRFLLLSSFAFDSSMVGIFWTLCNGGTLVIPPRRIEQDLDELENLLVRHRLTHSLLLPSLYEVILQHISTEKLSFLNTVIVAGEACSSSLVQRHFEMVPQVALYNEYGPTEATVWCTAHRVSPEDAKLSVPIGKGIRNAEIYILDRNLQPVPIGVTGEIYVGGAGVSRGYFKRPELTAASFIANPFADDPGARMYKTGDLGRYRSNGVIEFFGRADQQVKIRGHRIELDEIRQTVKDFEGVREAAITFRPEEDPDMPAAEVASNQRDQQLTIDQMVSLLEQMDPRSVQRLLSSVESLSEAQLDIMLGSIGNHNKEK